MLKNACTAIIVVRPSATNEPNVSSARIEMRRPAPRDHAEAEQDAGGADEPELLADDRVDEVGVRLGQVEQLLHAGHQPAAEDAAGADGDQRLDDLEAVAERIGPRIPERQQPAAAVRRADEHEVEHGQGAEHRADEIA